MLHGNILYYKIYKIFEGGRRGKLRGGNSGLIYFVLYIKVTTDSNVLWSQFCVNDLCVFPKNYQWQRNAGHISVMFLLSSNVCRYVPKIEIYQVIFQIIHLILLE
jgi:hypothetical protein